MRASRGAPTSCVSLVRGPRVVTRPVACCVDRRGDQAGRRKVEGDRQLYQLGHSEVAGAVETVVQRRARNAGERAQLGELDLPLRDDATELLNCGFADPPPEMFRLGHNATLVQNETLRKGSFPPCSNWDTVWAMGQKEHASSPINVAALRLIRAGFAEAKMTQAELARASGIPRSTLANILSPTAAHRLVHVEQLVKIAVAMGADARAWIGELEAQERARRGGGADELAGRRSSGGSAPAVQKRAARRTSSASRTDPG